MLNSDILFIYDAKLCNPNGDPDEENKPRMDYETGRNLVSDVRLKRYIRDYLEKQGYLIFVSKPDGNIVDATTRIKGLLEEEYGRGKVTLTKMERAHTDWLLSKLIDVRLFGATLPIKSGNEGAGAAVNFTGPVQFNWGYSLNPVTINPSSSITSTFAGRTREEGTEYGSIGKDWRVMYSLIAFHGIINSERAKYTLLKDEDILLLDDALVNCLFIEATTRSKIGQTPRLILRVEYKNNSFLGDLRPYVRIRTIDGLDLAKVRDIEHISLDLHNLLSLLNKNREIVNKVYYWRHEDLLFADNVILEEELMRVFGRDKVEKLPHKQLGV